MVLEEEDKFQAAGPAEGSENPEGQVDILGLSKDLYSCQNIGGVGQF